MLMGKIVATMKIFPEDIIIGTEELKEAIGKAIPEGSSLYRVDEEPIAFGLVALIAHIMVPETSGDELDKVEEAIRKVKGVSEVEILLLRRI